VSQNSVKNTVYDIAGYVVPVLQNRASKWKKKLTGVRHDNARPHASGAASEILEKYGWQVLPHPLYSPDMGPPDFDLFPKLKNHSVGNASKAMRKFLMM
jgi:histone-lysine N-methyltransferase SETMAR